MIRISFHAILGVMLCGCTVNNYHDNAFAQPYGENSEIAVPQTYSEGSNALAVIPATVASAPAVVKGPVRAVRPTCGPYVPLAVPKPVQIDFKELQAAESSKEINAIALRNVRELHNQIRSFAEQQQKHYAAYVARCVVKGAR